jgi:hypothetical protein
MIFATDQDFNQNHEFQIKKFWGRLSEMITGPDHEYVYLKRLINRMSINMDKIKGYPDKKRKKGNSPAKSPNNDTIESGCKSPRKTKTGKSSI